MGQIVTWTEITTVLERVSQNEYRSLTRMQGSPKVVIATDDLQARRLHFSRIWMCGT